MWALNGIPSKEGRHVGALILPTVTEVRSMAAGAKPRPLGRRNSAAPKGLLRESHTQRMTEAVCRGGQGG